MWHYSRAFSAISLIISVLQMKVCVSFQPSHKKNGFGSSTSARTCLKFARTSIPQILEETPPKDGEGFILDPYGKVFLKNLNLADMREFMQTLGEKEERATQVWKWMYDKDRFIRTFDEAAGTGMRDALGKEIRNTLEQVSTVDGGLRLESVASAQDGTKKMIFEVMNGQAKGKSVETVIIPMKGGKVKQDRYTICVSSQVGCAMNCQFCYTGRLGLLGNLMASQIVEQVVEAKRYLASVGDTIPVSHIVFMGMGEPFDNYDNVMKALSIFTEPSNGLQFDAKKITVSTVGLVPRIIQFVSETRAQLAVSLHGTTDEVRDQIVPVNRRYGLTLLMNTLRELFPIMKNGKKNRDFVVFEYTMLQNVNDLEADAHRLLEITNGINCIFNLITFNTHEESVFQSTPREQTLNFKRIMNEGQRICTIRDSRGDDNMSACGQLGDIKATERIIKASPFQQ
mmetsp:Transcript_22102/g.28626  ORF Transcript_22102/g.28626 Transcript_22102/m.28626 type:complete len:455 (+) Transcript_22102:53-1417(+)